MEEPTDKTLREALLPEESLEGISGSGEENETATTNDTTTMVLPTTTTTTSNLRDDEEAQGRPSLLMSEPREVLEVDNSFVYNNIHQEDPLIITSTIRNEGESTTTEGSDQSNRCRPRFLIALDISFLFVILLDMTEDEHRVDEWLAVYFCLLWLLLLVLPVGGGCYQHPSGLRLRDLMGVALGTLFFGFECAFVSDYGFYFEDLPFFLLAHLGWLAMVVRTRPSIQSPWLQRWFVLVCGLVGMTVSCVAPEDFFPFVAMLSVAALPCFGCGLMFCGVSGDTTTTTGGCWGCVCSWLIPCSRSIKRMELDAQEVEEEVESNNQEEEMYSNEHNQAQLDRQIEQLGRPMHTNSNTYLSRGQWAFAMIVAALALWVLIFYFFVLSGDGESAIVEIVHHIPSFH